MKSRNDDSAVDDCVFSRTVGKDQWFVGLKTDKIIYCRNTN